MAGAVCFGVATYLFGFLSVGGFTVDIGAGTYCLAGVKFFGTSVVSLPVP